MKEEVLEPKDLLIANHGVCFSSTRWSVSKDSGVEAIEYSFDERMCGFEIDLSEKLNTFSLLWLR